MTSNTRKNWDLCALCGIDKPNEKLVCPFNSKRGDCGSGYSSLANIIAKFSEIGEVPIQVSLSSLDEGKGVEETLKSHRASWHKSCFNRCSNEKLIRAQKRKHEECSDSDEVNQSTPLYSPVKTRVRSLGTSKSRLINDKTTCFFCGETDNRKENLRRAATLALDRNVRAAATKLQDHKLLSKLSAGDMHAIDAYYHASCLTRLYNRVRSIDRAEENEKEGYQEEAIALAELVMYIEEASRPAVFKLSDLTKLYCSLLEQLGTYVPPKVNSTRLKERILLQIPTLCAYNEGKEVKLAFSEDIGAALTFAQDNDYDTGAMYLAKAAMIVRKKLLAKQQSFNGTFDADCQRSAVPDLLLARVNMILEGPNVAERNGHDSISASASLMLSQLLIYNAVRRQRDSQSDTTSTTCEVEKHHYLSIWDCLYTQKQEKKPVDKLYRLGLSISYDRVMQISADLRKSVCDQFEKERVVYPSKLRDIVYYR